MDFYKSSIPIIEADGSATDLSHPRDQSFGMEPRDYALYPEQMFASPSEMQLIPESEDDARFEEQEANENSLEHLYLRGGSPAFVNLDQDGDGYCWAYSVGHSMMLDLLKQFPGSTIPRLNPHATAAIIKRGKNEGGWCGLSAEFGREHGYAVEGTGPGQWPLHSRDLRNDTPLLREAMARHKIEEDWYDLTRQVYDQRLTRRQAITCSFNNVPVPSDFNWWGHSVCQVRWVRIERGSWGVLILNSWKGWGRHGLAVLRGSQATANGAVATRLTSSNLRAA